MASCSGAHGAHGLSASRETCLVPLTNAHQDAPATVWIAPARRCFEWVHAADLGAITMQMESSGRSSRSRPTPATTRTPAGSWRSAMAFGMGRVSPSCPGHSLPVAWRHNAVCCACDTRAHAV